MKIIEFLDPKKSSHIIRPEYLKNFYLNSNYYLLPKNIFLKKILIFVNLKIIRKIRIFMDLLLKSKFTFDEPLKNDIVIFDHMSFDILKNIFRKQNYFVLHTRIEKIKKIYLSKRILFYSLKNFFRRSAKVNYLCSLIEIINPRIVITYIDNSDEFFTCAKIFKDKNIKFIAIQNAHRTDSNYQKKIYIPNYFVYGNHEIELLKNKFENISNVKPIGSLAAAVAKEYFKKNNIQIKENLYDICLVSEPHFKFNAEFAHIHKEYDYNIQNNVGLIANHVLKFCRKYEKKFIVSGKADINKDLNKEPEILSYKNLVENNSFDISFHKKSEFGNYKNIIQSKIVIGMCSSMLRESFEFKRKILWCNFIEHKDTRSPSEGICTLRSKRFEDFENRVLEILKLDYEEYLSKIDNVDLFYNTKVNAMKYLENEINIGSSI